MIKKVIIIGNTNYSRMLKEYLCDLGIDITAFCVDKDWIITDKINNLPVIDMDELFYSYSADQYMLIMGIGYTKLGEVRKQIYFRCKNYGYTFMNYIHPSAQIDKTVTIGEGNIIFENVVIQKNCNIGNANLFFSNSTIMHDNKIGCFNTFCAGSVSNGSVMIEDCCFFGANSTLRDSIVVCKHTLVGAGVYVNRNCIENTAVLPLQPSYIKESGEMISRKL